MPDLSTFALFGATSFLILVVPGPAVLFIVTRSLEQGPRAGLVSMLGVETGGLVHVGFATVGLSALLASSTAAFNVVKYAGAAYLIWLGLTRLLRRHELEPTAAVPRTSHAKLFRQGVIVNVLNPKVTIFFLALLPQFGDGALELLLLGLIYTLIAIVSDGAYALLAGSLGERLRRRPRVRARIERGSGLVYMLLGTGAVVES